MMHAQRIPFYYRHGMLNTRKNLPMLIYQCMWQSTNVGKATNQKAETVVAFARQLRYNALFFSAYANCRIPRR